MLSAFLWRSFSPTTPKKKKEESLSIDAEIIRYVVDLNKEQKAALLVLLKSIR